MEEDTALHDCEDDTWAAAAAAIVQFRPGTRQSERRRSGLIVGRNLQMQTTGYRGCPGLEGNSPLFKEPFWFSGLLYYYENCSIGRGPSPTQRVSVYAVVICSCRKAGLSSCITRENTVGPCHPVPSQALPATLPSLPMPWQPHRSSLVHGRNFPVAYRRFRKTLLHTLIFCRHIIYARPLVTGCLTKD